MRGVNLGEVYTPENMISRRRKHVPDLTPMPQPSTPVSLEKILKEIEFIKGEIEKIKRALQTQGISIE